MKKAVILIIFIAITFAVMAQTPQMMNYQCIVRDRNGNLLTKKHVGMRISILKGTPNGTLVYQETYNPSPVANENGLITIEIGNGNPVAGSFSDIDWKSGPMYLKTETDPSGGSDYSISFTSQLLSVPYSFLARTVEKGDDWGNQKVETDATISGKGTSSSPLTLARQTASAGQTLKWNGSTWKPADDLLGIDIWQKTGQDISYTTGKVGIGTTKPSWLLSVHGGDSYSMMGFTNNASGQSAKDGLMLGLGSDLSGYLYNLSGYPLRLGTSNETRIFIEAGGNVGIGNDVPAARLAITADSRSDYPHIELRETGSDFARIMFRSGVSQTYNWTIEGGPWITDADARLNIRYEGAGGIRNSVSITGDGKLGVNTESPAQTLDVNGNARFREIGSGAYFGTLCRTIDGTLTTSTSDIRFKENISELGDCLGSVMNLRGVSFTWKEQPEMGKRIGLIAQEVEKVFPELVFTNPDDGYKGVNYPEMTAVLVEAIKEQQKLIEEQKRRLVIAEAEIQKLEIQMSNLQEKSVPAGSVHEKNTSR